MQKGPTLFAFVPLPPITLHSLLEEFSGDLFLRHFIFSVLLSKYPYSCTPPFSVVVSFLVLTFPGWRFLSMLLFPSFSVASPDRCGCRTDGGSHTAVVSTALSGSRGGGRDRGGPPVGSLLGGLA